MMARRYGRTRTISLPSMRKNMDSFTDAPESRKVVSPVTPTCGAIDRRPRARALRVRCAGRASSFITTFTVSKPNPV